MINSAKNIIIYTLTVLLIGAGGWEYARRQIWKVKTETITIEKTVTKYIKQPENVTTPTLVEWANSPIKIQYKFQNATTEYTAVDVLAFDLNKSTEQEIRVPVVQSGNFKYYVAAGAVIAGGVIGYKLFKK